MINHFFDSINPGSTIIITGDISNSRRLIPDLRAMANALKYCEIYFVLGNHDFYGNTINNVRHIIEPFVSMQGNLHYLPTMTHPAYLQIGPDLWALIGVDGWADARAGNFDASPSLLKDYQVINDFNGMDSSSKRRFLNLLGKEEAYKLKEKLVEDLSGDNILIATHVPPYAEAHVYLDKPASPVYLPHFVCVSTGEVISEYALTHKNKNIHIICGHTHQKYDGKIMDNVTVHVGYANYSELLCVDLNKVLVG
jgi:predicted phosphohydrolase